MSRVFFLSNLLNNGLIALFFIFVINDRYQSEPESLGSKRTVRWNICRFPGTRKLNCRFLKLRAVTAEFQRRISRRSGTSLWKAMYFQWHDFHPPGSARIVPNLRRFDFVPELSSSGVGFPWEGVGKLLSLLPVDWQLESLIVAFSSLLYPEADEWNERH